MIKMDYGERQMKLSLFMACICSSLLFVTVAYARLYEIGFVRADDRWMLLHNELVPGMTFSTAYFKDLFTTFNSIQYSPLNTLYYALIFKINGYDPYYFHMFSFATHIANTVLIFLLVKRLLSGFNYGNVEFTGWAVATFWMISPINTETVVWISASKITLSAFFTFLCLLSFINGVTKKKNWPIVWAVIYFIISYFFKEQVVVIPPILLAFWFCYRNPKSWREVEGKWLFFFCAIFLLALIMGLITLKANNADVKALSSYPFYQRFFLSFYCFFFYIFNLFIPIGLHYNYSYPMKTGQPLPFFYYVFPLLFLIIIGCAVYYLKRRNLRPMYIFCTIAFLIHLGICLQIIPMTRPAVMADRYMYVPSVFLLTIVFCYLFNDIPISLKRSNWTLLSAFSLTYVLFLTLYSNQLVYNWHKINFK